MPVTTTPRTEELGAPRGLDLYECALPASQWAGALRVRLSEVLQYDVRVELEHVLPSCENVGRFAANLTDS